MLRRRRQLLLMKFALLFLGTCFLAYSNGANDNFKGVASLFGSRTCNYRTAIAWATVTTFVGSIISIFLAQALLKKFSGKGLVPDHFDGSEYFLLAVAIGAGLTVIVATLTGFPISTTHALTGAIIGCGLVAVGSQVISARSVEDSFSRCCSVRFSPSSWPAVFTFFFTASELRLAPPKNGVFVSVQKKNW